MGEKGTLLLAGDGGGVIGASAISDRFVGFIYGLVAKVLMPQEVNRDAFIKNFSSLWKGKEDVSIKEIAHNQFWVRLYVTVMAPEFLIWNHGPVGDPSSCWRRIQMMPLSPWCRYIMGPFEFNCMVFRVFV